MKRLFLNGLRATTILAISAIALSSSASSKTSSNLSKRLDRAGAFLSGGKITRLKVEKKVIWEFLDKTVESNGEIFVGEGKFRWETSAPEKSTVVFDGKALWSLQEPPAELGGAPQVTKSVVNGKSKDQIFVKILGGGKISKQFKALKTKAEDGASIVELAPLKPDPTVKDFSVLLKGKPERIREIRYTDDVGNLTTIRIIEIAVVKKPDPKLFQLEVPKGAEVNEL